MTRLRVVFFGTPAFAVPTLERLHASRHEMVGVITQPDRPRGRGHKLVANAVKAAALGHGLAVLQPERLRDEAFVAAFASLHADLGVVAAYGKILPAALIARPRLGMINVHASLLPRWRGAAPIHRAVLAGDRETGITIMRVVEALDAGPMLAKAAVAIEADETSAELERRLATLGASLLIETVDDIAGGGLDETPQDESLATYAKRLERGESHVDWSRPARDIHNQIRGLQPWPLAAVGLHGKRLLLLRSQVAENHAPSGLPGAVVAVAREGLTVAAGSGAVRLLEVQPEGRAPMRIRDFLNGHPVAVGDTLTAPPVA